MNRVSGALLITSSTQPNHLVGSISNGRVEGRNQLHCKQRKFNLDFFAVFDIITNCDIEDKTAKNIVYSMPILCIHLIINFHSYNLFIKETD